MMLQKKLMRFQKLSRNVESVYPDIKVYPGCEVYCEAAIMDQVVKEMDSNRYPTMNGSRYVLMEFSMWVYPDGTLPCVNALINAGSDGSRETGKENGTGCPESKACYLEDRTGFRKISPADDGQGFQPGPGQHDTFLACNRGTCF